MPDISDIHGGLLALSALAPHRSSSIKRQIFSYLNHVSQKQVLSPRNSLLTEAGCRFIANTLTKEEVEVDSKSTVPHWRKILDAGLRHRTDTVHVAAAEAMATLSSLVDCSSAVNR
jgi:hypothetical protein